MVRPIQQADVCIICALAEEAHAVEQEISKLCQVTFTTNVTDNGRLVYRSTTIRNLKDEPLTLHLVCQTRPGLVFAARDLSSLLELFQPRFVGMSGICAGDKRHLRLGDLVVAEYAYHCEEGKVTRDESGTLIHQPDGITYGPASYLLQYVHTFGAWKAPVTAVKRRMFETDEPPRCLTVLMASGMAVHSDDPFAQLQRQHRKAWALDMEAASFYQALRDFPAMDGLVVKSVCDYADLSKDDTFHDFAARASAIYLLTFIQEYLTRDTKRSQVPLAIFTVPYPRNPFFTGCEELLAQIHTHFASRQATVLALCGLGGIGKTQTSVEYAHRHQQDYQAVLWTAASTNAALVSGYIAIADELNLSRSDEQDQTKIVNAVKAWLTTQKQWLLILDNADDLSLVSTFLPTRHDGHILLTTRVLATGSLARRIEVDTMSQEVGALFLLRRASRIENVATLTDAAFSDIVTAREICEELGGLPLAIDQAGAYIEEAQCSLLDYQQRYRTRRAYLLQRRGALVTDHPEPVATTWSLSFEKVEKTSPIAADLLRLCAFLHPDAIPVELIMQGAGEAAVTEDDAVLDEAIATLGAYSLLRRDSSERTLSIHRLVQAVLQERMTPLERAQWKRHAKRALAVFTEEPSTMKCDRCRRATGKRAEECRATYVDPMSGEEISIPYALPLYCDECQLDLKALEVDITALVRARRIMEGVPL